MAITSNLERKRLENSLNEKINNLNESLTRKETLNVNNNTPFFYKFLLTDKNTEWSTINSNLTEDFNYISEYEAVLPYENSDSYKNDWNYHPIFTRLHVYKNENIVLNEILLLDLSDLTNGNQKLKLIENVYNFGSNSVNFSFNSLNNDGYYELDFAGNNISLNANTTISYSAQTAATIHLTDDANYNKILLSENTAIASEALTTNSIITLYGVINNEFDNETFEDVLDLVEGIVSGVEYTLPINGIDFNFLNNRVASNNLHTYKKSELFDFIKIPYDAKLSWGIKAISPEVSSETIYNNYLNSTRYYTATATVYNNATGISDSNNPIKNYKYLMSSSSTYVDHFNFITKINDAGSKNLFGTSILRSISRKYLSSSDSYIYYIQVINANSDIEYMFYSTKDLDGLASEEISNSFGPRLNPSKQYGYSRYYYDVTSTTNFLVINDKIDKNTLYSLVWVDEVCHINKIESKNNPIILLVDNSYSINWTNPNGEGNIEEILKGSQTNEYFIPQENQEKIAALEASDLKDKPYDSSAATIQTLQQVIANLQSQINDILNGNLTINATLTTSGYFDIKMPYFKNILKTDVTLTEHQTEGVADYYTVEYNITPLINLSALSNFEVYKPEIDFNDSTKSYFDETTFEISDSGVGSAREIKLTGKCSVAGYSALQNDSVIFDEVRIYMRAIDNTIEDQSNEGGE